MVDLTDTSAQQPRVLDVNPQTEHVGPEKEKGKEGPMLMLEERRRPVWRY
ncbi:hypothetical protein SESBI_49282 [Sesbania bispinosa]|nr:hypothetical protein SESBI_49282 [Sesbania bispinosa]